MAQLYLGLSGYSYKPWHGEGRFYPADLRQKDFFNFYSDRYNAVEMDGTWYRMPSEGGVQAWLKNAPAGFRYTFKLHRNVSHVTRLKSDSISSVKFMVDRLAPLEAAGHVGAIYAQLPPNFKRNDARLIEFLDGLPQGHPYAMEFRNESWFAPEVEKILKERKIAWVAWDTDEIAGQRRDTGPFIYTRLRRGNYTDEQLESWAAWFRRGMEAGKDCYVFFKHEDEGSPWIDAERLRKII